MSRSRPFRRAVRAGAAATAVLAAGLALAGPLAGAASAHDDDDLTVYTQTNAVGGNRVLAFHRTASGGLAPAGSYATGGTGTGAGLGSQGAVTAVGDDRLLVVNAGSDDVSLFGVGEHGSLRLLDREPSGGHQPTSVAAHGRLVYVLDAGSGSISGFRMQRRGLEPIAGSTRALVGKAGAQVSFTPDGRQLVVTEKATNTIDVFPVDAEGRAGAPVTNASHGNTPFGFAFDRRGRLVVSNAEGGAVDASSLTSYRVGDDGRLDVLDGPVGTTETAACWVVTAGRYVYTANAGSGSVTGMRIGGDGSLTPLDADGVTAATGSRPVDMAVGGGDVYTLNGGSRTITAHGIGADGSLTLEGAATDLPATVAGLAVA